MGIEMEARSLIIVENTNQVDRLITLAKKNPKKGEVRLVTLDESVHRELAARKLECKTLKDYGLSEGDIADEVVKWFRKWPDTGIKDSKNIKELILYDGISLWWLVDEVLYWHSFIFPSLKEVVSQVVILNHILRAEEPSLVYFSQNGKTTSRILELICNSRNIEAFTTTSSARIGLGSYRSLRRLVYVCSPWIRVFFRKASWAVLGRNKKPNKPPKDRKILIFSGDSWENVPNMATGEFRKGDPYFDSVIELIKDRVDITFITIPGKFNWGIRNFKKKSRQRDVTYRPFEYYLDRNIVRTACKLAKELNRSYGSLTVHESLNQSIKLDDIPLYNLIKQNLSFTFSRGNLTTVAAVFETAKRIVEIEKPDMVIVCGEFIVYERAVIAAAKLKGISVLSVQHGVYSPYFIHYNYMEEDISPDREATAPYCPIADKFAVYSKYDKDNFVQRAKLREGDVIVSGQPRYDVLTRANRIFNREATFKKFNLNPEKKLVVWMSLSQAFTSQENERHRNAIYNAVRSLNDVQLVVKLHPSENQKATQYREDTSFTPTIVGGWGSVTFELLYAADIVITQYYTCSTAIEAIILNRPLIAIDFSGRLIAVPHYVESGAAIGVLREDALTSVMERILYDKEARQTLAEVQRKYACENGYSQSGQASQIVADLVTQMVEESRKRAAY